MATASALSHRKAICIGRAELRPATCEIVGPRARETVQPKVMQVLVALAEARGETVTRDELILNCWDGRVIGEDSINRVIFRIRRLAADVADGTFTIKTITKVGYRLIETPGHAGEPGGKDIGHEGRPVAAPRRRLFRFVAAFGGLALTGLILATNILESTELRTPNSQPSATSAFWDATARDLGMRGAAASFENTPAQHAQAVGYFRQAIAQDPRNPSLWGSLAMNYYFHAAGEPPERQGLPLTRARQAALRSLQLNPREGHALAALMAVHPTYRNWPAKEAGFRRALSRMDGRSPAPLYQHARFLASVGRVDDALRAAERAFALHPLVPWIAIERINLLAARERLDEAEMAAEAAAKLWPRNEDLWLARFFLHALHGDPSAAARLADDRTAWPEGARPSDMALLGRTADAIASPSSADDAAVLAEFSRVARDSQSHAEHAIRLAAFWRRDEEALRLADMLLGDGAPRVSKRFTDHNEYALAGDRPTAMLFVTPAERLWALPEFMPLMERVGLADYWRSSSPPDFCREVHMRESCRGVANPSRPLP